ncbi:hypothetical protein WOLCODRAFT_140635 [Wolfiporia cocos MD-104 SS10]|uniref:non-specific serine/threonine protein kinase n=1 Tax=Wolfiporia cocos (strain MD-104) TaxID=742152 RepID=A0A2H3J5F4_WOLCO|nr:hypothetical protein WOLCODRAFT_140635 [Wolfiporia cocos MD-104 SS10]
MTINGLLLALLTAGKCLAEVSPHRTATRITDLSTRVAVPHERYHSGGSDGFDLLDIVLVASIDGKLHALNRTSGDSLWSMTASSGVAPVTLGPLVRTQHPDIDPDLTDDDSVHQEVYVVEPQSGDIFVLPTPNSPLQRLPFSMPQLVDMSPFKFSGDDDARVFVGKKETSLLLIELETGRVKATLSSECPWDPFQDLAGPAAFDVDLDELEGSKQPERPTEVYIGRTDYHVSIYTRPTRPSSTRPPIQNLSFSVYGPNNEDLALQSLYRHTADSAYIQPLPNGQVLCFKSDALETPKPDPSLLWGQAFPNPIVAVFDVLHAPKRQHPFVLLQPHLRLEDILPHADLRTSRHPDFDRAFVGIVEETGSLFAMSPDNFPLVVFGDAGAGRFLDAAPDADADTDGGGDHERDFPSRIDMVARRAKERSLRRMCRESSTDRRCLTGVRKLESSTQSRFSRLLDAAPVSAAPMTTDSAQENASGASASAGAAAGADGASVSAVLMWDSQRDYAEVGGKYLGGAATAQALSAFTACTLALLVVIWYAVRSRPDRQRAASSEDKAGPASDAREEVKAEMPSVNGVTTNGAIAGLPLELVAGVPPTASAEERSETPSPLTLSPSTPGKRVAFLTDDGESDSPMPDARDTGEEPVGAEDTDKEGDAPATPGKRKGPRRKRGKKKKGGAAGNGAADGAEQEKESVEATAAVDSSAEDGKLIVPVEPVSMPATPVPAASQSLVVSDTVLGFGSHGTVVFKGSLQGRAVAVKRLLQDFVTLAAREVNILQESDDHPNVIRYYYQESQANFLYIALELCPASLADIVERPDNFSDIVLAFEPKRALRQITAGLRHLHALKIVHRDIKPQNILISHAKKGVGESAGHRMLISDFGLCRKLDYDQTSFLPTSHGAMAAGTVGWRAPEILRGEVKLDDSGGEESQSSRGSVGAPAIGTPTGKPTRLTKSVDIFALGCLYYYVLTNGGHPFGDRFERESNILKNAKSLDGLVRFGEEGSEGADLIARMLSPEAYDRPDTSTCLLHPYFWDPAKRLTFLQDASDRFEIMCRDPRDPNLTLLETGAFNVVGNDWHSRLDRLFIENLGKFRKYDGRSVQDLLRALRNKKHHYQDLPDNVKRLLGSMPEGFLAYFTQRFPQLLLHVHSVVSASSLRNESMFRTYYELTD